MIESVAKAGNKTGKREREGKTESNDHEYNTLRASHRAIIRSIGGNR